MNLSRAGRPKPTQCELCGDGGKIVYDHDHYSDKFRGWLCDRCNRTLGQVKDNINLLRKMISYLEVDAYNYGETDKRTA